MKVCLPSITANESLGESGIYMEVETRDRHFHVGVGCFIEAYCDGKNILRNRIFHAFGEQAVEFADFKAEEGRCVELVKFVSMYTEMGCPEETLQEAVYRELSGFEKEGYSAELSRHLEVYERMWQQADVRIVGDWELDRAVRFNIFHLMSTGNKRCDRVNLGAKLLSGEEYGGHAFWDTELFMLPYFAFVFPKTAQNLENYRFHLLDAARENAVKNGFRGAQYPWESADDGTEQCPDWTIESDGNCTRCYVAVYEHHVTAAVAYGIYNYAKITGDQEFLFSKGAEILTETARFWTSRYNYIPEKNRYDILQVTGPDEWHEPVDNNVYTNYLARWNLRYVISLVRKMINEDREAYISLIQKTGLTDDEIEFWDRVQQNLYLPKKEGTRLLEQFEGYFDLEEVLIEEYDENDWPIRPKKLNEMSKSQTQIIKQADVVMLLYLMGQEFDKETLKENYDYYEKRTLHGSSLSPSIYAIMGLRTGDTSKAYRYLRRSAFINLLDLQKNTREGIHAANTGGVWQTVVFGFAGVSVEEDGVLSISPKMPEEWECLTFRLHYRGAWLEIIVNHDNHVKVTKLDGDPIAVRINGVAHEM